ncbi:hypothetical protein AMTR_s00087p00061020 [Amborella trichopoda]|uniref:Uncharacterized protein n=1 Tax=Amborella trichopoda TaxID=13333 RepID=W1NY63_AMBTC|nr:hypothetical protein AMTR_s00087p00061020 [Amborella trichopoda]
MPVLRRHIDEMESLLSRAREEMRDFPLPDLYLGTFPLLARQAGSLMAAVLQDRLTIRQCVSAEVGAHKE